MRADDFASPLLFAPVYKPIVWGGRRMEAWRSDLPSGPIGESWDLSDHRDGMSVVAGGAHAGRSLSELMARAGEAVCGPGFAGKTFPLMVKLIDATDRLSVQVHPDDALARALGVGDRGKTECWLVLADGGALYQGTRPGVDRAGFEAALGTGSVAHTLNRFQPRAGDFFFLEARTVHALDAGCLVYEIQQTSNVTFRVYDWGRLGLDGKPRPIHVDEALKTIDFARSGFGPQRPAWQPCLEGGEARVLVSSAHFAVEEWRGERLRACGRGRCRVVVCVEGEGELASAGGAVALRPTQTALVPAAAGDFSVEGTGLRLLLAEPAEAV